MKIEFEGKETLYVLFGFPALIAGIIWITSYVAKNEAARQTLPEVKIESTLRMPEGAVKIENKIPPAEVHNHEKIVEEKLVAPASMTVEFTPKISVDVQERPRAEIVEPPKQVEAAKPKLPVIPTPSGPKPSPDEYQTTRDGTWLPPPKDTANERPKAAGQP